MPNKDGTGPKGEGSRTGRGLGNCEGGPNSNPVSRGRCSRRDGSGRGRRCCNRE